MTAAPQPGNQRTPPDCRRFESRYLMEALTKFEPIMTPVPPGLRQLFNYSGRARFLAVYYAGGKATWDDGRASATFSYYHAYQPFTAHPVVAMQLFDKRLGSDDAPPSHALIFDFEEMGLYVGAVDDVLRFTYEEAQKLPPPQAPPLLILSTLSEMTRAGMFEIFSRPDPELVKTCREMLAFLDGYITEDVVRFYQAEIGKGNMDAFHVWHMFMQRLREASQES